MNHTSSPLREHLKKLANSLPQSPGVYQFLDEQKKVLYVGKAKNLKERVYSYFQKEPERTLSKILLASICDIRFTTTPCEQQALFLEHKLIQNHNPPFNTRLRYAGFPFPYIKLVLKKSKIFLYKTRNFIPEQGIYFGPYADVSIATNLVKLLNYLLPIDPQSFYHQDRSEKMSLASLRRRISNFLKASDAVLIKKLHIFMRRTAKAEKYFIAAICKQLIVRLQTKFLPLPGETSSNMQDDSTTSCQDVVHFHPHESGILLLVLRTNASTILSKFSYFFPLPLAIANNFLQSQFLNDQCKTYVLIALYQLYLHQRASYQISHILLPFEQPNIPIQEYLTALQELLSSIKNFQNLMPVILYADTDISSQEKLHLAQKEAKATFFSHQGTMFSQVSRLDAVRDILHLTQTPSIIEAFDVANTEDQFIMGGVVRFVEGYPDRNNYRIFHIKGTRKRDDFYSIHESVHRRYSRCIKEKLLLPQLILIDGGKGQLSSAYQALQRLQLETTISLVSLAKKEEDLYIPHQSAPLSIKKDHPGLLFLISVRNEVHKFVNGSHRKKRDSWSK